ncbi:MAG: transposase [Rhodobacter sp.]|nr:transposase [Rhodobacter sp.]
MTEPKRCPEWCKGRSSHRVQRGVPEIRRRYRGRRFWGRGYFPATTGASR